MELVDRLNAVLMLLSLHIILRVDVVYYTRIFANADGTALRE